MRFSTTLLAAALASSAVGADHAIPWPTPRAAMREMATDRPDTTESPITLDAGHVMLEAEPASWTRDRRDGVTTTAFDASANLKLGLDERTDLQLIVVPVHRTRARGADADESHAGVGDTTIRLKRNLWGDDGGGTAFAVLPFVNVPTAARHDGDPSRHLSGGLITPLGFDLGHGWDGAVEISIAAVRDGEDARWAAELLESATVGHALAGGLSFFGELVVIATTGAGGDGQAYLNGGLVEALGPNAQADCGFNAGLTRASDDLRLFVGLSLRR